METFSSRLLLPIFFTSLLLLSSAKAATVAGEVVGTSGQSISRHGGLALPRRLGSRVPELPPSPTRNFGHITSVPPPPDDKFDNKN
ncbi:hypothetical protein COCNU_05G006560 [Cocos nucifera]|uniref:Uncharacterized protein n=1 Tax=Cocos nucifera TaxID=13894 RepID=A0A8K0I8N7_COCNU|nr:hypothetical protein COCNU_05G006560 [Cocos nucifera]